MEVARVSSSSNAKTDRKPQRKRRWDAILIGLAMTIAFITVVTRFTGYSPCDGIDALQVTDIRCSSWVQANWDALVEQSQEIIHTYTGLS